ncbi:MAG: hypothetical protein ACE5GI_07070, partial [Candidatus Aminicenantales bacterium]
LSVGISKLIREGAEVITGAEDVLEFFGMKAAETETRVSDSLIEHRIIQQLQKEPMEIDNLSRILEIPISEMGTVISMMQIKGIIFNENGKYYLKGA